MCNDIVSVMWLPYVMGILSDKEMHIAILNGQELLTKKINWPYKHKGLFLGFVLCSTGLYVCLYSSNTLFCLLYLCNQKLLNQEL